MAAVPTVTRRRALLGALCIGCSSSWVRPVCAATASSNTLSMNEVAPGIYVRRGIDEDASPTNDDAIANIGFVVGHKAVAVMDPGGSLHDGQQLRAAVRRVTHLPISHVVMSHVHPDHIFGAGAFQQDKPQFVGHSRLPQALASRGEYYRKRLDEILGAGKAGPVVMPTQLVQDRVQLDLGGRVLEVTAHAVAHSDCDLTMRDAQTGTLFAADLLFVQRIPALDGSIKGWLNELNSLKTIEARLAVPGHGPTSVKWPSGAADLERYLRTVLTETRQAIAQGQEIDAAAVSVGQSERGRWKLFDDYNGHNVTQAFKELEWE